MKKIIIMKGLPGAGKSTKAKTLVGPDIVRVNKDLLREMLHYKALSIENERTTIKAERILARALLDMGKSVIVDDTNLGSLEHWYEIGREHGAEVEILEVTTDLRTSMKQYGIRRKSGGHGYRFGAIGISLMALFSKARQI